MNRNIAQQNAERRLRHCKWDRREAQRRHAEVAAAGFISGLLLIAALAFAVAGPEFFL